MKCAVYTRVSTDNQAEIEFNSCESQTEKIKSFINSQENMKISSVYSDPGFTGAHLDRPALRKMLQNIKQNNIDMVIVYKMDRLTRSPKDFYHLIELFEEYNVVFISVTERFDTSTPSGRLLRNIMLTFAQFERELVSERVKDKMLQRATKGMWNGGGVPFGYKRENKKLVIVENEAKIVKNIYETYISTGSLVNVYNKLIKSGIKNKNGQNFTKTALSYILRNINYTGKRKYAGKVYNGIHSAIISDELFNQVQALHSKRLPPTPHNKKHLLTGILKCEECHSQMTPCSTNKQNKDKKKNFTARMIQKRKVEMLRTGVR